MSIEGIFLSPAASAPMQSLQEGKLIAGVGLEGDRYSTHTGSYSVLRLSKICPGEREPGRQLTLISADSIEAAFDRKNLPMPSSLGDIRRNIVIRSLSSEELLDAVGHVIKIGQHCRVLVHRHTVPCMYNERKNGIPGMMEAIWRESGVSCEILAGGPIKVGDSVEVLMGEVRDVDDGNQPPGYYTAPSKRGTAMVMGSMKMLRELKKQYAENDPDGVARVEASYGSVGLTFWPKDKK